MGFGLDPAEVFVCNIETKLQAESDRKAFLLEFPGPFKK